MAKKTRETLSSKRLAKMVADRGLVAVGEETSIHYTLIWRYATARTTPTLAQALKLEQRTRGRVPAHGWV